MDTENFIESIYRELEEKHLDFIDLYRNFGNQKVSEIFSTVHFNLLIEIKSLNTKLPTEEYTAYYHAEDSRSLLYIFEIIERLQKNLEDTEYKFKLDDYYDEKIKLCKTFINKYYGSEIPRHVEKIELYYTIPIFVFAENQIVKKNKSSYQLKLIGSGSYANVFEYKDEDYNEKFVLKRLKKNATEKDLIRFKQEYRLMKSNPHPNIVRVYKYFDDNSYTMDYCGTSLKKFIDSNNTKLTNEQRKNLIYQLLDGIKFLHDRGLYHRDISYNNVLIDTKCDDLLFLKISDFGLIKDENNKITSSDSSIKGTFIDPCLEKFENYNAQNDIYALGMMINYIYFGKQNISTGSTKMHNIISKCVTTNLSERYKTVNEIIKDLTNNNDCDIKQIKLNIIENLKNYSANDLPSICESLGLKSGTQQEAYKSKSSYIRRRIAALDNEETVELEKKITNLI